MGRHGGTYNAALSPSSTCPSPRTTLSGFLCCLLRHCSAAFLCTLVALFLIATTLFAYVVLMGAPADDHPDNTSMSALFVGLGGISR